MLTCVRRMVMMDAGVGDAAGRNVTPRCLIGEDTVRSLNPSESPLAGEKDAEHACRLWFSADQRRCVRQVACAPGCRGLVAGAEAVREAEAGRDERRPEFRRNENVGEDLAARFDIVGEK